MNGNSSLQVDCWTTTVSSTIRSVKGWRAGGYIASLSGVISGLYRVVMARPRLMVYASVEWMRFGIVVCRTMIEFEGVLKIWLHVYLSAKYFLVIV